MNDTLKYLIIAALAIGLLALVSLQLLDLVDFSNQESSTKVIAALVALTGVVFTGVVTLFGFLINGSVAREAAKFNRLQEERNAALAQEVEGRLRLEAAIKACDLMSVAKEKGTPQQNAAALFALSSLGHEEFALYLLDQMWAEGNVTSHGATWVVGHALSSGNADVQTQAAQVLAEHASHLVNTGRTSFEWFTVGPDWNADLPRSAREALLSALLNALVHTDRHKLDKRVLNGTTSLLYTITRHDDDVSIRIAAALGLTHLVKLYHPEKRFRAREGEVTVADIQKHLEVVLNEDGDAFDHFKERADEVAVWSR